MHEAMRDSKKERILNGNDIIKLLDINSELELMFVDGNIDFIKQPFTGPMAAEEFLELIRKIQEGKQRGKMKLKRSGKYIEVFWERSLK